MKKQLYTIAALLVMGITANAQVGIGTVTPDASSMLDIKSTTAGFLMPRMTTADRTAIASPAAGLQVFDTTSNTIWFFDGTAWKDSGTSTNIYNSNGALTSNRSVNMAANTLTFTGTGTGVGIRLNTATGSTAFSQSSTGRFDIDASNVAGGRLTVLENGNVGIGTASPGSTLHVAGSFAANYASVATTPYAMAATDYYVVYSGAVAGTFTLPASTATTKGRLYTIKNNTLGLALTVTPAGAETIDGFASIGVAATNSAQLINTGSGWEVDRNASDLRAIPNGSLFGGTFNHITQDAGFGSNGTSAGSGSDNIGIGSGTLNGITTGIKNIAIGSGALKTLTTSSNNTAIGFNALSSLTPGFGTGNTAIGSSAGLSVTTGNANLFFGSFAGSAVTTGTSNFLIGSNSGSNITTGGNNLVIGNSTTVADGTASAQMNIGNVIYGTTINVATASIGIKTNAPLATFDVNGSVALNRVAVTASYAVLDTDCVIQCNNGATAITVTLPAPAASNEGKIYYISRYLSTGTITINSTGTVIDSGATALVSSFNIAAAGSYGSKVMMQSTGTTWLRVN